MTKFASFRAAALASVLALALAGTASSALAHCLASPGSETAREVTGPVKAAADTLFAVMPLRGGFGPGDHDAYETRIAPVAADHGMSREGSLTVSQQVGAGAPQKATILGFWSLRSSDTVTCVMSDPRYQAQIGFRNKVHDMANVVMYDGRAEFTGAPPASGQVLLVGLIAMKPGFSFDDHAAYEARIAEITARHGMHLVRAYRVNQRLSSVGAANVAGIYVWSLPSPQSLAEIMQDPDYVAMVPERNRTHDMAATTMYFAAQP